MNQFLSVLKPYKAATTRTIAYSTTIDTLCGSNRYQEVHLSAKSRSKNFHMKKHCELLSLFLYHVRLSAGTATVISKWFNTLHT